MPKILVADDDAEIRVTIAEALEVEGFHVIQAESRESAISALKANEDVLLAIVDVNMAGGGGLSVATFISEKESLSRVLVILITGEIPSPRPEGVDHVLLKPFRISELLRLAFEWCGRQL